MSALTNPADESRVREIVREELAGRPGGPVVDYVIYRDTQLAAAQTYRQINKQASPVLVGRKAPSTGEPAAPVGDAGAAIPTVPPRDARSQIVDDDERLVETSYNLSRDRSLWLRARGIDDGGAVLNIREVQILADQLASHLGCRLVDDGMSPILPWR